MLLILIIGWMILLPAIVVGGLYAASHLLGARHRRGARAAAAVIDLSPAAVEPRPAAAEIEPAAGRRAEPGTVSASRPASDRTPVGAAC